MHTFTITSLSKKGVPIAKECEKKFEVRGAIVGETVEADVTRKRRKGSIAELKSVLTPSSERITPKCVHASVCGGCVFQHLSYEGQLKVKQKTLAELFPDASPIVPCDEVWQYRNKMEYTFSQDKEGKRYLGLIRAASKGRVENINECHLTHPFFVEVLSVVREWWERHGLLAYKPMKDEGHLRNLVVRRGTNSGEQMVMLVVSGNPDYAVPKQALEDFVTLFSLVHVFVKIHQAIPGQRTQFFEHHLAGNEWLKETYDVAGRRYTAHISPSSFFQPNTLQMQKLYERALQLAQPKKTDLVYDLYCGMGTIGMAFAPYVEKVYGIELNPYAVYDAQLNLETNSITNMEVVKGDVGTLLLGMQSPDIAIVDPPRAGLEGKALPNLLACMPKKIVYISCNPYTQQEDVEKLVEAGYQVTHVQPVDQFPHTPHVENIVVLAFQG